MTAKLAAVSSYSVDILPPTCFECNLDRWPILIYCTFHQNISKTAVWPSEISRSQKLLISGRRLKVHSLGKKNLYWLIFMSQQTLFVFMTECEKKDYNILWHSSIDCSRLKATFWYRFSKLLCGDHAWGNMLISCHDHPVRHHDHDVFLHK